MRPALQPMRPIHRPVVARVLAAAALLACLVLAGCSSLSASFDGGTGAAFSAAAPTGTLAGSAAAHGTPQSTPGDVKVRKEGSHYVAEQTVTVSNDFGGAAHAVLSLATANGRIDARRSDDGGYRIEARLFGQGATESEARAWLASMTVGPSDALASGTLTFGVEVTFHDRTPAPESGRGASLSAALPASPAYVVDASTSNGDVAWGGGTFALHGPRAELTTSNGRVSVAGAWDELDLHSSNGEVAVMGECGDVAAETSNGAVTATVTPSRSSKHTFSTANGKVTVRYAGAGAAYDVTASTSNGEAKVQLGEQADAGDATAELRSQGWDTASVQVKVTASTSNGGIDVRAP